MIDAKRPLKLEYVDGKYVVKYLDTEEVKDVTKQMKEEGKKIEQMEKEEKKKK